MSGRVWGEPTRIWVARLGKRASESAATWQAPQADHPLQQITLYNICSLGTAYPRRHETPIGMPNFGMPNLDSVNFCKTSFDRGTEVD